MEGQFGVLHARATIRSDMAEFGSIHTECNRMHLPQARERRAADLLTGVERPNQDECVSSSQMSRETLPTSRGMDGTQARSNYPLVEFRYGDAVVSQPHGAPI